MPDINPIFLSTFTKVRAFRGGKKKRKRKKMGKKRHKTPLYHFWILMKLLWNQQQHYIYIYIVLTPFINYIRISAYAIEHLFYNFYNVLLLTIKFKLINLKVRNFIVAKCVFSYFVFILFTIFIISIIYFHAQVLLFTQLLVMYIIESIAWIFLILSVVLQHSFRYFLCFHLLSDFSTSFSFILLSNIANWYFIAHFNSNWLITYCQLSWDLMSYKFIWKSFINELAFLGSQLIGMYLKNVI